MILCLSLSSFYKQRNNFCHLQSIKYDTCFPAIVNKAHNLCVKNLQPYINHVPSLFTYRFSVSALHRFVTLQIYLSIIKHISIHFQLHIIGIVIQLTILYVYEYNNTFYQSTYDFSFVYSLINIYLICTI